MYLFILSPPFCGSTVLYKMISTSSNVSTFIGTEINGCYTVNGEGQDLIKNSNQERFYRERNKLRRLPIKMILSIYKKYWDLKKPILCDKSPPFTFHAPEIERYVGSDNVYFIILMRDPYSCRWNPEKTWIEYAQVQKKNLEKLKNTILIRYEDLITEPEKEGARLSNWLPLLKDINVHVDYSIGITEDKNGEVHSRFLNRIIDKEEKNKVLKTDKELLRYFGYNFTE